VSSNFALFDRSTLQYNSVRFGTFTGFTRRSKTVGASEPEDVALPLREFIGQFLEETPRRFRSAAATDSRAGSRAGRTGPDRERNQADHRPQRWCLKPNHTLLLIRAGRGAAAACSIEANIAGYAPHRHMFPESHSAICSRVGDGLSSSNPLAAMICPGVQKPHWAPTLRMNASCSGSSAPSFDNPSMVRTDLL